jgi:hypothetical protein
VEELKKDFARTPSENISTIIPQLFPACRGSAKPFYNFGLAWRRIVQGKIVEIMWKHLVNAAPDLFRRRTNV